MLNIAVCIKEIPEEIRVNKKTYTLIREGIKGVINPCDKNAIELSVTLKEKHGGKVTLISMGPQNVEKTLIHGLAMGADQAVFICDKAFAGADTLATAFTLVTAIKKLGHFQLILCGKASADSGTQHIGPQIANFLGITQVTYAVGLAVENNKVRVKRQLMDEYETVEVEFPVLISVVKGMNEPRIPSYVDIYEASKKDFFRWSINDLGLKEDQVGLTGSPTKISKILPPETIRQCKMLQGTLEEICNDLAQILKT
ncbi:MAG: electron transfer flavoprotein subunit beta/FixA family protein [Syntrophaceae bacterium]|nr:electron transfer flavoprotein subunit beta/FixA family protein [Syntrophaceae bacterium]